MRCTVYHTCRHASGVCLIWPCNWEQVLDRIMRCDYRLPRFPHISPECRDLLQRILVGNPDDRLTIDQIQRHPWCGPGLFRLLLVHGQHHECASTLFIANALLA